MPARRKSNFACRYLDQGIK